MHPLIEEELKNNFFTAIQTAHFTPENRRFFCTGAPCENSSVTINQETFFDLASLTKALFTTPAFYHLFSQKEIAPNTKVSTFFSSFSQDITLVSLLNHTVGFPAWIPFYEQITADSYLTKRSALIDTISLQTPDWKRRYSDLTFILLGFILEEIYNQSLQTIFQTFKTEVFSKSRLQYGVPQISKELSVATSLSSVRNEVSHGIVEDENCHWLGGVTGHAGLFGSADDVASWMDALLKTEWFPQWFSKTNNAGFDLPEPPNSNYGDVFSSDAAGHLGFTGTAILFSQKSEKISVVLTNRTHQDPDKKEWKTRIRKIRRLLLPNP